MSSSEPLDRRTYAKGMKLLAGVFPGLNLVPQLYYRLLVDLRTEDFTVAVGVICREVVELFPNTNLVALIRAKAEAARVKRVEKQRKIEDKNRFLEDDPGTPEQAEDARRKFNEMRDEIAKKRSA